MHIYIAVTAVDLFVIIVVNIILICIIIYRPTVYIIYICVCVCCDINYVYIHIYLFICVVGLMYIQYITKQMGMILVTMIKKPAVMTIMTNQLRPLLMTLMVNRELSGSCQTNTLHGSYSFRPMQIILSLGRAGLSSVLPVGTQTVSSDHFRQFHSFFIHSSVLFPPGESLL